MPKKPASVNSETSTTLSKMRPVAWISFHRTRGPNGGIHRSASRRKSIDSRPSGHPAGPKRQLHGSVGIERPQHERSKRAIVGPAQDAFERVRKQARVADADRREADRRNLARQLARAARQRADDVGRLRRRDRHRRDQRFAPYPVAAAYRAPQIFPVDQQRNFVGFELAADIDPAHNQARRRRKFEVGIGD